MLPAFEYLQHERHLSMQTIREFSLGYCDAQGTVYVPAGNLESVPSLDFRFHNSTIFPVCDWTGNTIGVSSRPLVAKPDLPKYVNTEYQKADHLYGLNVTLDSCIQERKAYVVEGNIDVLMSHQAGLKNVVGMLGSNFSWRQLALLSRFVEHIVFVPDGDTAGDKFLEKMRIAVQKKYNSTSMKYSTISLPRGFDPDKFFQSFSVKDFISLERPLLMQGEI